MWLGFNFEIKGKDFTEWIESRFIICRIFEVMFEELEGDWKSYGYSSLRIDKDKR